MIQYAYAIYDGDELAVFDWRPRIFWQRSIAIDNCPPGFEVKKIKMQPIAKTKSKVQAGSE